MKILVNYEAEGLRDLLFVPNPSNMYKTVPKL